MDNFTRIVLDRKMFFDKFWEGLNVLPPATEIAIAEGCECGAYLGGDGSVNWVSIDRECKLHYEHSTQFLLYACKQK